MTLKPSVWARTAAAKARTVATEKRILKIDDERYKKRETGGGKECGVSDGQAKGVNICKRRDAAGTVDEVVVRQTRKKG